MTRSFRRQSHRLLDPVTSGFDVSKNHPRPACQTPKYDSSSFVASILSLCEELRERSLCQKLRPQSTQQRNNNSSNYVLQNSTKCENSRAEHASSEHGRLAGKIICGEHPNKGCGGSMKTDTTVFYPSFDQSSSCRSTNYVFHS